MNNKWPKYLIGIVIVVLVGWGIYSSSSTSPIEAKTVRIGVVAPMTGGGALFGNALWRGMQLAQEDLGKTTNTYEIVVEDDGTNPAQSATAASKLINIEKVDAIVTTTSGSGHAVAPLAKAAGIPHICVCSDPTVADGITNYTNSLLPADEGAGWAQEAAKRGVKSVAFLTQIHPGINAIADATKAKATAAGIQVVHEERFEPNVRDFKTMISKARAKNPEIFFVLSFPPSLDIVGQELHDMGVANITSTAAFALSTKPELFEGKWYMDAALADTEFRTRFETTYPTTKFNVRTSPFGYDSFMILVDGFEEGSALEYLRNLTNYRGKVGEISKSGNGNLASAPAVWILKNGIAEPAY